MTRSILISTLCLLTFTCPLLAETKWVEKGTPAPFSGKLFDRISTEDLAVLLVGCDRARVEAANCSRDLDSEKRKSSKLWRRPAFWVPVSCLTFVVGFVVGAVK
jgi:hypothetical protein